MTPSEAAELRGLQHKAEQSRAELAQTIDDLAARMPPASHAKDWARQQIAVSLRRHRRALVTAAIVVIAVAAASTGVIAVLGLRRAR